MGLESVTLAELQAELRSRAKSGERLRARRAALVRKLAALDEQIARAGLAQGRRFKNKKPLEAALVDAIGRAEMSVTRLAQVVQHRGYRTSSPNFRTIVNQTVINSTRFRRVRRGVYAARSR